MAPSPLSPPTRGGERFGESWEIMTISRITESTIEQAALAWLESLGYAVKYGTEIAPGEITAGCAVEGAV